jgi:hypothetical protein
MSASLFPGGLELGEDACSLNGFTDFNDPHGDGFDGFDCFDSSDGFGGFDGFDCSTGLERSGGRRPNHDLASRSSSVGFSVICPKSTLIQGIMTSNGRKFCLLESMIFSSLRLALAPPAPFLPRSDGT